jgi:hypothetical protein
MPAHRVQAFSPAEKTNAKGIVENSQSCEFFPARGEVILPFYAFLGKLWANF